jgi:hypothetical protein
MLQKNPLCPPVPSQPQRAAGSVAPTASANSSLAEARFVSADDFDATGVLAGMDPSESRYWWMPELYGPDAEIALASRPTAGRPLADALEHALTQGPRQATRRSTSRSTAAA